MESQDFASAVPVEKQQSTGAFGNRSDSQLCCI